MKLLISVAVVGMSFIAPLASFAQSNQPLTRDQVKQELVDLHNAGYSALDDRNSWPTHLQAAEARITARKDSKAVDDASYGPASAGTTQIGSRLGADTNEAASHLAH
jgi:hypothetical protein